MAFQMIIAQLIVKNGEKIVKSIFKAYQQAAAKGKSSSISFLILLLYQVAVQPDQAQASSLR